MVKNLGSSWILFPWSRMEGEKSWKCVGHICNSHILHVQYLLVLWDREPVPWLLYHGYPVRISMTTRGTSVVFLSRSNHHHHHHLPPWIRSFDLFRHRRVAIFSWGVHDLFSPEVCSWGRVSEVWCCPFFRDSWSSSVCIWISRLVFQRSLVPFLWLRFVFCLVLCIP